MFSDIDKSWAVHLAIVPDCSATSFVKSLKRFIARKGTQNLFLSDNGTQFKNDEMKHSQELVKLILNGDTSWKPVSGGGGGASGKDWSKRSKGHWEKILGRATVNSEDLTIITVIEGMINSGPPGYLYTDDVHENFTPLHVVYGRRISSKQYSDSVVTSKKMKYIQTLIEHFCNCWKHEYLTELREHQTCWRLPNNVTSLDGIVLIQSDKGERALWRMGEVIELIKGADGVVRAVLLKTSLKNTFCSETLGRPIERLCPQELKSKTRSNTESKADLDHKSNCTKETYIENERSSQGSTNCF